MRKGKGNGRAGRSARRSLSTLLLGLLTAGGSLQAQEARVLPVDEAAKDAGFFAFRASLQRAIAERDTAALLAVVDPDIKLSFGGDYGIERFRETWLTEPELSIWAELGTVLALGGRFYDDSTFAAPYTFTDSPDDVDPYEALIALGDSVPLYAAPDHGAEVVGTLSFDVVRHAWDLPGLVPEGWVAVRLRDGTVAYATTRTVRSPIYYRAIFDRPAGHWRMSTFIAGD